MANEVTFTNLAPVLYSAMNMVARELTGFIPSVMLNTSEAVMQAQGDSVQSIKTSKSTLKTSYTPAMTVPNAADKANEMDSFAVNQFAGTELPLKGELAKRIQNIGLYGDWLSKEFAQMIRAVINPVEAHLGNIIKQGSSRAYGTAGTSPFNGGTIAALAQINKILKDNGADPEQGGVSCVMDTLAGADFRSIANLYKVNEAGDGNLLRQGAMGQIYNILMKESAGVSNHTKGTGTLYDADGAGAIDDTTITLDGGTAGATGILAGDIVTFAGDTNKYAVNTGLAAAAGDIVLGDPGLRAALADTTEMTIGDSYTANMVFHQSAAELAARAPAQPPGGDLASDEFLLIDPVSGLPLQFRYYKGYGMGKFELNLYYQGKVWNSFQVATLLG